MQAWKPAPDMESQEWTSPNTGLILSGLVSARRSGTFAQETSPVRVVVTESQRSKRRGRGALFDCTDLSLILRHICVSLAVFWWI